MALHHVGGLKWQGEGMRLNRGPGDVIVSLQQCSRLNESDGPKMTGDHRLQLILLQKSFCNNQLFRQWVV